MKIYPKVLKGTLIAYLIGGIIIYWGYSNNGFFRILIGILILVLFTIDYFISGKRIEETKLWWNENGGKLIFFYPTNKNAQNKIEIEVIPLLPDNTLKVYYNGPKLVGDIPDFILNEIMVKYAIKVNQPCIFKIVNDKIHLVSLTELREIDSFIMDNSELKSIIEGIISV